MARRTRSMAKRENVCSSARSTVRIEVSQEIDRPVAAVFTFFADDHVRNHPRWDPDIELWRHSDEPIGLGTIIQRRNSRSGTIPVEGTMEVVEYEPNRAFRAVIREGGYGD